MRVRILLSLSVVPFLGSACSNSDGGAPASDSAPGGPASASADAGDARQAIDAAMARYIDAVERGDTAAIAASLSAEPIIVFPTGRALKGKSEVSQAFADMLSTSPVTDLAPTRTDLMIRGDVAVETGTFEVRMRPAGGREIVDKGQYQVVWQRQADGAWKLARGFNRSDAPPKP